jgi:hypothetical protein
LFKGFLKVEPERLNNVILAINNNIRNRAQVQMKLADWKWGLDWALLALIHCKAIRYGGKI